MGVRLTITFGWESIKELLADPNFRDLVRSYHRELWGEFDVPCDPDWARRVAMEEAGVYRAWTARVDRTWAGFIELQIGPTLNAKGSVFAIDAGHYITPTFRGIPRLGYRMWRSAFDALKREGVNVILAHDNMKHPLMPFMLSLGMRPIGTLFMKVLDQ